MTMWRPLFRHAEVQYITTATSSLSSFSQSIGTRRFSLKAVSCGGKHRFLRHAVRSSVYMYLYIICTTAHIYTVEHTVYFIRLCTCNRTFGRPCRVRQKRTHYAVCIVGLPS